MQLEPALVPSFTRMTGMRRLLIVGCGDVGLRILPLLRGRYRLYGLTHSRSATTCCGSTASSPLSGNLDDPDTLVRLAGLAARLSALCTATQSGALGMHEPAI